MGTATALTKLPVCDEGFYASPAYNLAAGNGMGTTVLESAGTSHTGLHDHTYWVQPLHIVMQSVVYKAFGAGLVQLRMLSVFWGLVLVGAVYLLLVSLLRDRSAALLGATLTALCAQIISITAVGRADPMCAGLGFAGLAAFLHLRRRNFALAVLISQALVVASGMTHPLGIGYFMALLFLTVRYDRASFRPRHLGLVAIPYATAAVLWGLYILEAPADFAAQFGTNVGGRLGHLTAPWAGVAGEFRRYVTAFGFSPDSAKLSWLQAGELLAILTGVGGVLVTPDLRRTTGTAALLWLAAIMFACMVVFEGTRQDWYLIHILPFLFGLLAAWLAWMRRSGHLQGWVVATGVAGLLLYNLALSAYLIRRNDFGNRFAPAVEYLAARVRAGDTIFGSAELGFGLGFDRTIDDHRLGFHSGKRTRFIVEEPRYAGMFSDLRASEPAVFDHIREITDTCAPLFDNGHYRICERELTGSVEPSPPAR